MQVVTARLRKALLQTITMKRIWSCPRRSSLKYWMLIVWSVTLDHIDNANDMKFTSKSYKINHQIQHSCFCFLSQISKWPTKRNTFGWVRAEILGALVNAVFLLALCFSITVEALQRLVDVEEVGEPRLLLCVGGAGLVVNIIGLILFGGNSNSTRRPNWRCN